MRGTNEISGGEQRGHEVVEGTVTTMRLYRGLTKPYRSEKVMVSSEPLIGTDFTDCPLPALRYAHGARGVLLILDIDPDSPNLTVELWLGMCARRYMVWGGFDRFIKGAVPAKELRALVWQKGIATYEDSVKSRILKRAIEEKLSGAQTMGRAGTPTGR